MVCAMASWLPSCLLLSWEEWETHGCRLAPTSQGRDGYMAALLDEIWDFVCITNPMQDNNMLSLQEKNKRSSQISFQISINRSVVWKAQEVIIPLCLLLVRSQLEYCARFWAPTHKEDADKLEWVQKRTTRVIRCFENVIWERLKELGLFSPKMRKLN